MRSSLAISIRQRLVQPQGLHAMWHGRIIPEGALLRSYSQAEMASQTLQSQLQRVPFDIVNNSGLDFMAGNYAVIPEP